MVGRNKQDAAIEKIVSLMQTDDSADAPADSLKWAKNLFRTRTPEPKRSLVQRIVAVIAMDLAANKPAFGERSASAAKERQMLFNAGRVAVDLRLVKTGKNVDVRGQILGEGFGSAVVRIASDAIEKETTVNERSEFAFKKLPGFVVSLTIEKGDEQIIIEKLDLDS